MAISRRTFIGSALIGVGLAACAWGGHDIIADRLAKGKFNDLASAVAPKSSTKPRPFVAAPGHDAFDGYADDGIDFDSLVAQNSDVIGWIRLDAAGIDLPVVQTGSNDDYMRRDLWGNYSPSGTPFDDYRDAMSGNGAHSLIFGHHMTGSDSAFSLLNDCYEQARFDELGLSGDFARWTTRGSRTRLMRPCFAMKVYEDYAPIQTFDRDFVPTDDEVQAVLSTYDYGAYKNVAVADPDEGRASASASGAVAVAADDARTAAQARVVRQGVWTSDQREQARDEARDRNVRDWLDELSADATASNPGWSDYAAQFDRVSVATLACCSSLAAGQPWRTLLVCVGPRSTLTTDEAAPGVEVGDVVTTTVTDE